MRSKRYLQALNNGGVIIWQRKKALRHGYLAVGGFGRDLAAE